MKFQIIIAKYFQILIQNNSIHENNTFANEYLSNIFLKGHNGILLFKINKGIFLYLRGRHQHYDSNRIPVGPIFNPKLPLYCSILIYPLGAESYPYSS